MTRRRTKKRLTKKPELEASYYGHILAVTKHERGGMLAAPISHFLVKKLRNE